MAQSPPPPLGNDLMLQVELNQQQQKQVCDFVTHWGGILNGESASPAEIEGAREQLTRPLNQPNASRMMTPNFRGTYSKCAVPEMEKALDSKHLYRAINALLVLSQLGTDRASSVLLMHADSQNQPAWQLRLRAADGERLLLLGGALDSRKALDAARKLRDAASREENGSVLRLHFAALDAADGSTLQPNERSEVRSLIGEAIAGACQRLSATSEISGPMVQAVASAVGRLRERITDYNDEHMRMGVKLAPALGATLAWTLANWDSLRGTDATVTDAMNVLVASSEGLLQFTDPRLASGRATPTSDINGAWKAGDKTKFETGLKAWQAVLSKPPYAR